MASIRTRKKKQKRTANLSPAELRKLARLAEKSAEIKSSKSLVEQAKTSDGFRVRSVNKKKPPC